MPENIYRVQSGYQVRITRRGTSYSKTFATKREAQEWRDQKLEEIPPTVRPEQWRIQSRTGVKGIGFTMKRERGSRVPYVLASWQSDGRWYNRGRSVNAHGLEGALAQCLHILEDADYLDVPIGEARDTALPHLEHLLEAEQE